MRRSPSSGLDLTPYTGALPLLARNPTIIIVPFLAFVAGVLLRIISVPGGADGFGGAMGGIVQFIASLIALWGLGAACVHADLAWRRNGTVRFDAAWTETQARSGEILAAALILTFVFGILQTVGMLVGGIAVILMALAAFFTIWTIPAAAIGGIPGMAALNASVERVRANPLPAGVAAAASIALYLLALFAGAQLELLMLPLIAQSPVIGELVVAFVQAIAAGYAALFLTKAYSDAAFGRRW